MFYWLLFIFLALIFVYWMFKKKNIWEEKGIPYTDLKSNILSFGRSMLGLQGLVEAALESYNKMPDSQCMGMYFLAQPVLMIKDPEIIKQILVKDFDHFMNHNTSILKNVDEPLFKSNLVGLEGTEWKQARALLSPMFTGSKMRGMFSIMKECGDQFVRHFQKVYHTQKDNNDELHIELKNVFTRYTNDVIASTAFGIECNSFENPDNPFFKMGSEVTKPIMSKFIMLAISPKLFKLLGFRLFSDEVRDFFSGVVKENIETRQRENITRPDLIHLLMETQKEDSDGSTSSKKIHMDFNTIVAQCFLFFFGGFDTVSVPMCFATYELALNPELAKRLQNEIDETLRKSNGDIDYETFQNMTFLDNVISETLRKWPPGIISDRACSKAYNVTLNNSKTFTIDTGMLVHIPIYGIHMDPKYYPNPEKFDPDRFSEENKNNIQPFTYLPFGHGPRNCIASRFGLLEVKLALFYLFGNFDVFVTKKTEIPVKLENARMNAKNGFWLGLKPREKVVFY